ncbi:MAG: hypothetical protein K9N10_00950, partial [Deltaproteobacteria bacterium]|nr:hypothetical protein [Deltaproteobacteria bacterium]
MKTAGLKKSLILWGILISFLAMSLSTLSAAEKTPPYTGWKPPEPFQPFKSAPPANKALKERTTIEKPVKASPEQTPVVAEDYQPQEYVVQEGDWIAKILREKGVLKEDNLPKLLKMLRKFNQSMKDFDLIKPGEKIVILVKVESGPKAETPPAPKRKVEPEKKAALEKPSPAENPALLKISRVTMSDTKAVSTIQQLKSEPYRIQQGDILSMVVMNRYDLTLRTFITEYLDLFKKSNPSIKNPDRIFPGQNVNLPLYPPQWYAVPAPKPAQPPIMRDLAGSNRVRLPNPTPVDEPEKAPTVVAGQTHETARKTWFSKKAAVAEKPRMPDPPKVLPQSPPPPTKKPEPLP